MGNSFYSQEELLSIGFKRIGDSCLISRNACFYGVNNIEIGNHVRIDDFCILSGSIILHDYIHISAYASLFSGKSKIEIGDFCAVSSRTAIYAESDDYSGETMVNPMIPEKFKNLQRGEVILKKHVIIGSGSTVLPDLVIGEGVAVGAMSLINRDLEEWTIYAGIPCRRIRERSRELLSFEGLISQNQ